MWDVHVSACVSSVCVRRGLFGHACSHHVKFAQMRPLSLPLWWYMSLQRGTIEWQAAFHRRMWLSGHAYMEMGWMLCVGVTTYGRHRGRIYNMLLSWGEGVPINLQYTLQMASVSGSTRTCVSGRLDSKGGKSHKMTLWSLRKWTWNGNEI